MTVLYYNSVSAQHLVSWSRGILSTVYLISDLCLPTCKPVDVYTALDLVRHVHIGQCSDFKTRKSRQVHGTLFYNI